MQPTNELRFVRRPNAKDMPPGARMILQQKWRGQVIIDVGGDPNNQITEWREEWRDVPVENE